MEYIFGTEGELEVLKTKGREHTGLTGYRETRREYSDCVITDNYRVVEHIRSAEDVEGNCYDWYVIDRHYRTIDKATIELRSVRELVGGLEDAICEADKTTAQWRASIEDALCEIDEREGDV